LIVISIKPQKSIFSDWLKKLDMQMRRNPPSHRQFPYHKVSQKLTNVTIHFLSPKTTSVLQPLDAGIIRSCKAKY